MSSDEFFYMEDGKKQDKDLHEPILNNPKADARSRKIAKAVAIRVLGLTEEEADEVFG